MAPVSSSGTDPLPGAGAFPPRRAARAPETALAAAFSAAGEAAPDTQAALLAPSLFPGGDNRLEFEPAVSLFATGEGAPPAAMTCDTSFDCGSGESHHGESDWSPEG